MIILITGGASGLGEAITKALAKDINNKVYFTYSKSAEKAYKIEAEFANTVSVQCDFNNLAEVNSLAENIASYGIDILVNNAYSGNPIKTYFHKNKIADFSEEFNANIVPTVILTQACINHFRKKKNGKIITILTSFLTNIPPTGASIYVANKAYLKSLVNSWASENIKFNITSNSISPSFMQTNIANDVDERVIEQIIESHPLKRLLTIEEVADAVLYLTKATTHLNGIDLLINAGSNIK